MTEDLHMLAAAYALDALDPEERRRFEAHYPGCPTCRDEVADYRATAARLGAVAPAPLPADLKDRVLGEVDRTRQLPPRVAAAPPRRWIRPLLAVAAIVALLALAAGTLTWIGGRDDSTGRDRALARVLGAADVRTVRLDGASGTTGTLRVVYSAELDRAFLVGSDLRDPGTDRTYQLWAIGDAARSAGVFTPNAGGSVDVPVELPAGRVREWGVTNEPAGGSPAPTTAIVFRG